MSALVRNFVFCIALCSAPGAFSDIIRYEPQDTGAKDKCWSITADRPGVIDDILSASDAAPVSEMVEMPEARTHGLSWVFFLAVISVFAAAKTALFYRPVHRAGVAYARLYWDFFNPLEF